MVGKPYYLKKFSAVSRGSQKEFSEMQSIVRIYKKHFKHLKNKNISNNKKAVICFSGIPGAGKTYIAKILEKRYKGVRIRSDDIREIVKKLKLKEREKLTHLYLEWLFRNYPFRNKLIILDKSIDRKYKETFKAFKERGYKIFVIRIKASRKVSEERVKKKLGGKLDKNYIDNIERWIKEWEESGKKVKPDILIQNDKNLDLKPLFEKLDRLVK